MTSIDSLIAANDLDELVREVDRRCASDDWAGLVELRDATRRATEVGYQLWPAASLAEYRMALLAPPEVAGQMVVEGAGHLGLGPLSEVAASTHTWADLRAHVPEGPLRSVVAQERVIRGEDVGPDGDQLPVRHGVSARLEEWEPRYRVARYHPDRAEFPAPRRPLAAVPVRRHAASAPPLRPGPEERALADLAATWVRESEGICRTYTFEAPGPDAVALATGGDAEVVEVEPSAALELMAWTAASGGAHGRRRGTAHGRASAWWAAAVLTGLDGEWPPPGEDLGEALSELRWWVWSPAGGLEPGWVMRLAVEDPVEGMSWVIDATDRAERR